MSQTISLPDKYTRALAPLGDLKETVDKALQRYLVEQITSKIAELQAKDKAWREKYGCDYETFLARTAEDETFVEHIQRDICKTWELDLAQWEFCRKGIQDWYQHLQETLLSVE
ncbi:MAG: hypothetical protein KAV99_02350 [Candidatus Latescibacteria bacterium]|nr:hypothetical protein [Candidatus Latescibacterota bacterium]